MLASSPLVAAGSKGSHWVAWLASFPWVVEGWKAGRYMEERRLRGTCPLVVWLANSALGAESTMELLYMEEIRLQDTFP